MTKTDIPKYFRFNNNPRSEYARSLKGTAMRIFDLYVIADHFITPANTEFDAYYRGRRDAFAVILQHITGRDVQVNPRVVVECIAAMEPVTSINLDGADHV